MRNSIIITIMFLQAMCFTLSAKDIRKSVKIKNLIRTVEVLTSDSLGGRLAGSGYDFKSARYIAGELLRMGYEPLIGDSGVVPFSYKNGVSYNVVMILRSSNDKAENILLGAHYDHLGIAENSSAVDKIEKGDIFRGANDNASGVASMLEIARLIDLNEIKHNLIVCAFGAEEDAIYGSREFVKQLSNSGIKISFMINLEMLGTLSSDRQLEALGCDSYDMKSLLKRVESKGIKVRPRKALSNLSDHYNFVEMCPVTVFATTKVVYYHHPLDDISTLNFKGMSEVTSYISRFIRVLLTDNNLQTFYRQPCE